MRKTFRKTLTLCGALLLLFSSLLSTGFVKGAGTDNRIFIQPNGTVTPADAPIQIEGNTYTLTGNVNTSIVIEKSGITLNGAGHALQGTFNGTIYSLWMIGDGSQSCAISGPSVPWTIGVDLSDSGVANLTIENVAVENFSIGMYIWTQNNTITNNTIKGNIVGVLVACSQNTVTGNRIENNTDGIFVGIAKPNQPIFKHSYPQ